MAEPRMERIVALAKRRGFIFPGSEIYGGLAGTWDYGPLGVELKNNIKNIWWEKFVQERDDIIGLDTAIIMNRQVWVASGHAKRFSDWLMECKECHERYRDTDFVTDEERSALLETIPGESLSERGQQFQEVYFELSVNKAVCKKCGGKDFTKPRPFNLMLKTFPGAVEDETHMTFLRPETAQGMFVNFKNILDTMHPKLPFGIAQIGKAFRNEITPGNFIFRVRELEQMEIEYFIRPGAWEGTFESWLGEMRQWVAFLGLDSAHVHEREVPDADRAHYSRRTVDIDYDFPFGREELYGIAYRTDFDLTRHAAVSGADLSYFDEASGERIVPHVIEPTFGVDRTVLALLVEHYREDGDRVVLALPPRLAPVKVAVFPLLANKPDLVAKARSIYETLRTPLGTRRGALVAWDDRGNIGKRYYSQDEIGTPWCVTIDFQTLGDGTVTVRDRDTMQQERVAVAELNAYFQEKLISG